MVLLPIKLHVCVACNLLIYTLKLKHVLVLWIFHMMQVLLLNTLFQILRIVTLQAIEAMNEFISYIS